MFGPENLEEAKRTRYNHWAGSPNGNAYDPTRCAAEILGYGHRIVQCHRKPGHGTDKIFCKQHARMREGDAR